MPLRPYLRLARPVDWLKNGFVPLGLLFGEAWSDAGLVGDVVLATGAFCLAASAVYAANDVADADADRRHPHKKDRPVAGGQIAPAAAIAFAFTLAGLALAMAAAIGPMAVLIVGAYLTLNAAYTLALRRVPFLDVATIAAGFMLRVLGGTTGVGIPPSEWLLATTLALALFLGFAKRRAEFANHDGQGRQSLRAYNLPLLNALTLATAISAGGLYLGFTVDRQSVAWHAAPHLWLTAPPALAVLGRYVWLVFLRGKGENPARDLIGDPWIAGLAVLWLAATVATIGGLV
ncbi:MAG: UbiA prenyltransferase family protein [Reyranellaceae bacterium]